MENRNWTVEETKKLFGAVAAAQAEGKGLKNVFYSIANQTGKKPNSVRNFYYAHMKALSLVPKLSTELGIKAVPSRPEFKTFAKKEIESLIRNVLIRQAKGESVRKITTALAQGDKCLMLRYQNKYRSIIFHQKRQAEEIMKKLREEKLTYFNPYTKAVIKNGEDYIPESDSMLDNLRTITNSLGDAGVSGLFTGLARLAYLAAQNSEMSETEILREKDKEIMRLQQELVTLKSNGGITLLSSNTGTEKLKDANKSFLQKPDKDKLKSLGDYVSELGKILADMDKTV